MMATQPEPTLDQIMERVPGMMTKAELELLGSLASQATATIVELGSFAGLSTITLCLGARPTGHEVVTVDAFQSEIRTMIKVLSKIFARSDDQVTQTKWSGGVSPEQALRANLATFGVSPRIVKGLSWAAADQVAGPVGLLLVDADHTRTAVERDLAAWAPKMTADGVVVFDDYVHGQWVDVREVADEWAAREGWTRTDSVGKVAVFRRAAHTAARPWPSVDHAPPGDDPPPPSSGQSTVAASRSPTPRLDRDGAATVQAYLEAFQARDLEGCLRLFADDAVIVFISGRWEGDSRHRAVAPRSFRRRPAVWRAFARSNPAAMTSRSMRRSPRRPCAIGRSARCRCAPRSP